MNAEEAKNICQQFALKHKVIFDDTGECGFGRECVGFNIGNQWLDHNPTRAPDYDPIPELACPDAYAPDDVNSYHKHECLAVLGRGDEAVIGLAKWVQKMESAGTVSVVEYETGATGMQAMFSGVRSRSIKITKS